MSEILTLILIGVAAASLALSLIDGVAIFLAARRLRRARERAAERIDSDPPPRFEDYNS